ncbi:MAG TPA: DUF4142 domain-containing protein [Ramlibacter sp.]|jgi:putative membrane protein
MKSAPALRALPIALALSLGSGWAAAQSSATGTPAGSSAPQGSAATTAAQPAAGANKLSHGDREFMEDAAKGDMFEVQFGQLAASKASDPAVKDLGSTLVQDHTKSSDELKQIAQSKNVKMPDKPSWGQRHELSKLGKLSGQKFDQEFARYSVKDHQDDIKKFQKEAGKAKDPDVKAFAEKTLPVLRKHLEMAQKLPEAGSKNANASTGAAKKSG